MECGGRGVRRGSTAKVVNVIGAVESKGLIHVSDGRGGVLAHHSGRAKPEGWDHVEIEVVIVMKTQVVVVAGINAQLAVRLGEVFLEDMAAWAFHANEGKKSVDAG